LRKLAASRMPTSPGSCAHREWLRPWVSTGHAPLLLFGDEAAKVLVTRYLPGTLVEGTGAQDDPEIYRQAGSLLATFHGQLSVVDDDWNDRFRARVERHLALPHRIDREIERCVYAEVSNWPGGGARVVPTHGDWQPRNWLIDDGTVRVKTSGAPTCAHPPKTLSVLRVRTSRAIPRWRRRSSRGTAVTHANRRNGGPWWVKR
jgi:hypothetical protein